MSKPHGSITQRPVPIPKKKFISPILAKDPQKTEFEPPPAVCHPTGKLEPAPTATRKVHQRRSENLSIPSSSCENNTLKKLQKSRANNSIIHRLGMP